MPLANVSFIPQSHPCHDLLAAQLPIEHLYEERPEFDGESRGWTLWAYDRPRDYIDLHPNATLDEVIDEIDDDPTGIFWG